MDKHEQPNLEEISVSSNVYYSKKDFWNNRFEKYKFINTRTEGFFDWYVGWEELKSIVMKYVNDQSMILMVGCGNSSIISLK